MNYFFSKKAIPNYSVWAITLMSSYVMKISDLGKSRELIYYLVLECMLWFFIGVLLTGVIQIGLETFTKNKKVTVKALYLVLLMLIASVIFNYVFWPLIDLLHEYFLNRSSYHGKFATRIFNWLNWIIWFVSFTAFNLYTEVKEAKMKNLVLEATLKESQLNTLKGQINPHFMFNSLNNIRGLMLEDVGKARQMLTSLSETLRYALTQNSITTIALEDELEMVEKYIDISKIQFENRLHYETVIDNSSLSVQIPPMLVQMLIENAIKHGISKLKEGGRILLSTKVDSEKLFISVINSGVLKKDNKTTQVGVENIKKRLELLYKSKAIFSLEEREKEVVSIIEIPLS
ncbi:MULTISPECIES: sensor histidine kinase [unclassified Tenacibaculum]|uniref:sensor histidine kinase n=1 Tax=unclassified Tenacibaculum TaxID=2635139 RepID=UPI001F29C307|nr:MULTISPECIES: histidine kinase [unclassified Tenacibaculum]MCF2873324.1 histidine kinase [Tenacibaculum sp. Cn5-1]MCF2933480.1 histidine kinase [Tenacibaculum sp. Cn5-34]MCG7509938.1 histidine kinase [Tenacibaculum sp. Cn5-46]